MRILTGVSLLQTPWNPSSHRGFSFSPLSRMFRAEKPKLDRSHLLPACVNTRGGILHRSGQTLRPTETPPVSHRLEPWSHRSSINLWAVQPSGGHLRARKRKPLPQKVTSWVPCTGAQVWHHSALSHHANAASIIRRPRAQAWWDKACSCVRTCCCWTKAFGAVTCD